MQVIIIGAGIIGVSAAYQLARSGANVIVVDAGSGAATDRSFGWINASFYNDDAHHRLRVAGIEAYGRLLLDVPDLPVKMCGALWWEDQGAGLGRMEAKLSELGYPVQRLTQARLHQLEPDLVDLPQEALLFPSEGAAESAVLCAALLRQAQGLGARVVRGVKVRGIMTTNGRVTGVETETGGLAADQVIVASGTGAPDILGTVNVELPMLLRPGAMVVSAPVDARIGRILVTPEGEVRQLPDGRLMSPAAANHQGDRAETIEEPLNRIAERTCSRLARLIGVDDLAWSDVGMAFRPVPADGLPVIGAAGPDGLIVAVMHSGITLAAITAEVVADMVMKKASNTHAALLASYDPMRFSAE